MGNYTSQPYQPNKQRVDENFGLLSKVMEMRQNKYDVNKQRVQAAYSQIENLRIRRPEDQEYLQQKLSEISSQVESSGNLDLSQSFVSDDIIGRISNAAKDERIINAVGTTRQLDLFDAKVSKIQEKGDGRYNAANYEYALEQAGFSDYMNNKSNKLKAPLVYNDYVDVSKTALEKVKAIKETRGQEEIEIPNPNDPSTNIRVKVSGMTANEIVQYMPNVLSDQERTQLKINGFSKYKNYGVDVAKQQLSTYKEQINANLNAEIEKAEQDSQNTNLTADEQQLAQRELAALKKRKDSLSSNIDSVLATDNLAEIAGYLEYDEWLAGFANAAGAKKSQTFVDNNYIKMAELDLKIRGEKAKSTTGQLTEAQLENVSIKSVPTKNLEDVDTGKVAKDEFVTMGDGITGRIDSIINEGEILDSEKKAFELEVQQNIKQGKSAVQAKAEAFNKYFGDKFPQEKLQLDQQAIEYEKLGSVIVKAESKIIDVYNKNPDKYVKGFYNMVEELKQSNVTFNIIESTSGLIRAVTEKVVDRKGQREVIAKANEFIERAGGYTNIEKYLKENPDQVQEFGSLTKMLDETYKVIGNIPRRDVNLVDDAKEEFNKVITNEGTGVLRFTNNITIADPKVRERIANAIQQTPGQENFNKNLPITAIPKTDGSGHIEIYQSKGTNKDGELNSAPSYVITKEDDLYGMVSQIFQVKMNSREVTATTTKTPIKNQEIKFLNSTDEGLLRENAVALNSAVGGKLLRDGINPSNYLTKETTFKAYKTMFPDIEEQKLKTLTDLMAKQPTDKFSVQAIPQKGQFSIKVDLIAKGTTNLSTSETNQQYFTPTLTAYVRTYPQVMVAQAIYTQLKQDPTKIDELIQRLQ